MYLVLLSVVNLFVDVSVVVSIGLRSINIGTRYAVVLSRDASSRVRPLPASWRRCTLLVIGIGIFARSIATNVTVSCLQTPPFGILAAWSFDLKRCQWSKQFSREIEVGQNNANKSDKFSREIEVGQNNANKSDKFSREIEVCLNKSFKIWFFS